MASGSYVVLMTSPADTDEGMERLVSALEEIDGELAKRDKYERNNSLARYIVQDSDTYQYILKDKKERRKGRGRICLYLSTGDPADRSGRTDLRENSGRDVRV